jgi:hypothetical protein
MSEQAFKQLGRELVRQWADAQGESIEQTTESAIEKLQDDDLVAFALVAMRDGADGVQTVGQRAIDPQVVADSDHDPEDVVETVHEGLVRTFDEEVRDA